MHDFFRTMDSVLRSKKRSPQQRVFVNRSLRLNKINFYGFDMDHTLAVYVSPDFDKLCFDLTMKNLVQLGYPSELLKSEYDPAFTIRGLWLDKRLGTLLKVDPYGNILKCSLGFRFLRSSEIRKLYPNNFVTLDSNVYVLNTLFNSPEAYTFSCVVSYYLNSSDCTTELEGIRKENVFMSYRNIADDIRVTLDNIHAGNGSMKAHLLENLEKYVVKDIALPTLFRRMKENGKKVFLLTNSDYKYTNGIMNYLFDFPELKEKNWKSYFDLIVVDAAKPRFFADGTILRRVNPDTGALHVGSYVGPMVKGQVYSGGSAEAITALFEASGDDVLYFGDHIHGDVVKSKKLCGWRTFLIVPELAHEIDIWVEEKAMFDKLDKLNSDLMECYLDLDSERDIDSDDLQNHIKDLQRQLREASHEIDSLYGLFGSLFRSGSRQTFFAAQTVRYADLYAASFINLMHYPFSYFFQAPHSLMPHEQTIEHGDVRSLLKSDNGLLPFALKDSMLTNSLTSPLVARQHADECIERCKSPEVEDTSVSIPKGKVILRRQTVGPISSKCSGDHLENGGNVLANESMEDSSSDTEE